MPFDQLPAEQETQVVRNLRAARALLAAGWCQYAMRKIGFDGRDKYCLSGAMYQVSSKLGNPSFNVPEFDGMWRMVESVCPEPIVTFNNRPERTHAEILDLMDRAIDRAIKLNL